jgi:hypothetical protein
VSPSRRSGTTTGSACSSRCAAAAATVSTPRPTSSVSIQIVALEFLGPSLKQIRQVLERGAVPLADALRLQRQVLEDQRGRLDRALLAIHRVQQQLTGASVSTVAILKQLIEVIEMHDDIDVMKQYYMMSEQRWLEVGAFLERALAA